MRQEPTRSLRDVQAVVSFCAHKLSGAIAASSHAKSLTCFMANILPCSNWCEQANSHPIRPAQMIRESPLVLIVLKRGSGKLRRAAREAHLGQVDGKRPNHRCASSAVHKSGCGRSPADNSPSFRPTDKPESFVRSSIASSSRVLRARLSPERRHNAVTSVAIRTRPKFGCSHICCTLSLHPGSTAACI